ncbi:MAG: metal ABC transporter substrate-binding protein [Mariprofundaceae bacterium]|nr:metal ABC transporter substrate-binding protein [Mariprofundaceae bacterium]
MPNHKKMTRLFYSLLLILLSFNVPIPVKAADIITTLPPIAGLVHWLKPDANVACLLPANADPHHFQLSPRQVESLQRTKLLIRSSQDDGHWTSLGNKTKTFDLWPRTKYTHNHPPHDEHSSATHAWLNPHEVQAVLPKLALQLQAIYPENKQAIQRNLSLALKESQQLWQAWQKISHSSGLDTDGVIMQHPSWRNLFQALHITVFTSLESAHHGHEYGPHKLESALQQLQQHPNIRLIANKNQSNRALQWLQSHHPESIITTLDPLGSCNESWPSLMQRNLDALQP